MNLQRREEFLTFTSLFMGGMMLLTWWLSWWAGIPLGESVHFNLRDILIGVGAAFGMAVVFGFLSETRNEAEEILGQSLRTCRWYDFIPLALMVGFVEELLFRGVLEPWVARIDPVFAYFAVNAAFGAMHAVSWKYAMLAMLLGCLLSSLAHHLEPTNLLRPIVAHAVYDYIGFVLIARSWQPPDPADSPPPEQDETHHAG